MSEILPSNEPRCRACQNLFVKEELTDGLCGLCNRKKEIFARLKHLEIDFFDAFGLATRLAPSEEAVVVEHAPFAPAIFTDVLLRYTQGERPRGLSSYLAKVHEVKISPQELLVQLRKDEFKTILRRLKEEFNNQLDIIPIASVVHRMLRLEQLYQEADYVGDLKMKLAVLQTAHTMREGKQVRVEKHDVHIVDVIHRIEQQNKELPETVEAWILPGKRQTN